MPARGSDSSNGGRSVAVDPMVGGRVHAGVVAFVEGLLADGETTVHLAGPTPLLADAFGGRFGPAELVLHDAPEGIGDDEDPGVVRGRPRVPVRVAVDLLAEGVVDAVFSSAPPALVLTTASFRLGRLRAGDLAAREDGRGHGTEALRLRAAAQPGVAVDLVLSDARRLRIVDSGFATRATATDVIGRLLDAAAPGDRLGLLDATGGRGAHIRELLALGEMAEVDLRVVNAEEALAGTCDVVGCAPEAGAVMVDVLRAVGHRTTGVAPVTGVPGSVACLLAQDLDGVPSRMEASA